LIAFTLPAAMDVRVRVFDVQGRAVASLVNGWQEAGRHEIRWNGAAYAAAGMYFVRMEARGQSFTQRIPVLH